MADKFNNKYRIASVRLQGYDYGINGAYFITICTKNREPYFGEIIINENPTIQLSFIGKIAHEYWFEIPKHFPFVILDAFQIMPDHLHGIIIINKQAIQNNEGNEIRHQNQTPYQNKFGTQSKNLSSVIRGYKAAVKKQAVIAAVDFAWQERFHDHIIRDDDELNRIRFYINFNIRKWVEQHTQK